MIKERGRQQEAQSNFKTENRPPGPKAAQFQKDKEHVEVCHHLWQSEIIGDQNSFSKVVERAAQHRGQRGFCPGNSFYLVRDSNERKQQVQTPLVTKCLKRK